MTTKTERQEILRNQIAYHYDSCQIDFVDAFNTCFGEDMLADTTLSRQLSGRIGISNAWHVAYQLYFKSLKSDGDDIPF